MIDITTRCSMQVKAGEVSLYRHYLRIEGKCFNILNIREGFC